MTAQLYRVILPVTNIAKARIFYERTLEISGELVSPGRCYFDCEGTILACYNPVEDGDTLGDGWRYHAKQYLYFAVDDLEATGRAAKECGATHIEPIASMPWGETLFYLLDPFCNPICFVKRGTEFKGISN